MKKHLLMIGTLAMTAMVMAACSSSNDDPEPEPEPEPEYRTVFLVKELATTDKNQVITFKYNDDYTLASVQEKLGDNTNTISFTYNSEGLLTSLKNGESETVFTYSGKTIEGYTEANALPLTVYHFDDAGKLLYTATPSPFVENAESRIILEYDSENRVKSMTSVEYFEGVAQEPGMWSEGPRSFTYDNKKSMIYEGSFPGWLLDSGINLVSNFPVFSSINNIATFTIDGGNFGGITTHKFIMEYDDNDYPITWKIEGFEETSFMEISYQEVKIEVTETDKL